MLCALLQNPVVALLSRSALNRLEIMVCRNAVICRNARRTRSELLLILPKDDLCSQSIVIVVCSCDRSSQSILPTVYRLLLLPLEEVYPLFEDVNSIPDSMQYTVCSAPAALVKINLRLAFPQDFVCLVILPLLS